jgi:hypothetical protein
MDRQVEEIGGWRKRITRKEKMKRNRIAMSRVRSMQMQCTDRIIQFASSPAVKECYPDDPIDMHPCPHMHVDDG